MSELESYLTGDYPLDKRDVYDIEKLLDEVSLVYEQEFDPVGAWPYRYPRDRPPKLSQSTTTMILGALLRYLGYFHESRERLLGNEAKANFIAINVDSKRHEQLKKKIVEASKLLINEILAGLENPEDLPTLKLSSNTFGCDDIFTLAWLAEASGANWTEIDKTLASQWKGIEGAVLILAEKKLKDWTASYFKQPSILFTPQGESLPLQHAFPVLRLVQTLRRLSGEKRGALVDCYPYFEALLHEQLSYSSIPDSRFDPAELMFCLEGMLLCQRNVVDRTLFDRVLDVLTAVQKESAYWRPVKPYMASSQGLVLLPVSIEVANSLLRACTIFDGQELHATYGSRCVHLFRRYWQWLKAREVRVQDEVKNLELVGWHSEHVNDSEAIHLWETSQVVEFLLSYRNALLSHVARTTLVLSRFKYDSFPQKGKDWSSFAKRFEPASSLGNELLAYEIIGKTFVDPYRTAAPKNISMLLYGPPGTGKTTVAESIAEALGVRLITLTVSDFLAAGGAQVEARAKYIFEALCAQPRCVILFDEIDHFLLDRDSKRYGHQETVFQFMTPGMLTKLNDLRRQERAIFVVATNYEDRIDAAIKRTGRIDDKFLILPPDKARRGAILRHLLPDGKEFSPEKIMRLAEAALMLGFTDIRATVNSLGVEVDFESLKRALDRRSRTTSLGAYRGRFVQSPKEEVLDVSQTPMTEFLCLIALILEVKKVDEFEASEKGAVAAARTVLLQGSSAEITHKIIEKNATGLATEICKQVAEAFEALNRK